MSKNSIMDNQEENIQFCLPYGFRHEMSKESLDTLRKAIEESRSRQGQMFYYFVPASLNVVEEDVVRHHNIPSDFNQQ